MQTEEGKSFGDFGVKAGDRVLCVDGSGKGFTAGKVYEVREEGLSFGRGTRPVITGDNGNTFVVSGASKFVKLQSAKSKIATAELSPCKRITGQLTLEAGPGAIYRDVQVNHHKEYYNAVLDAVETSAAKNHDYASGDDPLGNFRGVEQFGIAAPTGLLCRMIDKWSRIRTYFTKGELKVQGEGLEDALSDLGNYCFLMIALLRDEYEEKGEDND